MEMEFQDNSRRSRLIIGLGVLLAVAAGAAAFWILGGLRVGSSGDGGTPLARIPVVVATRAIPARKAIEAGDVVVRQVPQDPTTTAGVIATVDLAIGRIPAVSILPGQLITSNLLTSTTPGTTVAILGPTETIGPDSEFWRAVSMTVPAERSAAGLLEVGAGVDIVLTARVQVPKDLVAEGRYYTDQSTKLTYQDRLILARSGDQYVIRVTLPEAEEIAQLQSAGDVQFSLLLRPDIDVRPVDAANLGATTNRIITKYGLPIPEAYPAGGGAGGILPPLPNRTPVPSGAQAPASSNVPGGAGS